MATRFESQRPQICRNLLKAYRQVLDVDKLEGSAWYPLAQSIVKQWSEHYRYSVDTVAAVVAAISPQVEWSRNLIIADDVLAQRVPSVGGVLHVNLRKAERLRDSDYRTMRQWDSDSSKVWDLDTRMLEQFPTGPKVLNFARNLAGDMSAVTVDTHALQCALNDPLSMVDIRPAIYTVIAECYMDTASVAQLSPATFQAILWHSWKRRYPRTWKIQHRTQWSAMGEI